MPVEHAGSKALVSAGVALVIAVGLTLAGCAPTGSTVSTAPSSPTPSATATHTPKTSKSTSSMKLDPATIAALSPSTMTYTSGAISGTYGTVVYNIGSIQGTPPRTNADSLCLPLTGSDPATARVSLEKNIWTDPVCGVTWANFFAHKTFDGVKLGDMANNKVWGLNTYDVDPSKIEAQAHYFVPLLNVAHNKITVTMQAKAIIRNQKYQVLAGWINTILNNYQVVNLSSPTSTLSYHLTDDGQGVGGLHPVGLDPAPDKKLALVMELLDKNACAPSTVIGANMSDSRPEQFPDVSCVPPPKTVTIPPGPTPPKVVCTDERHFWSTVLNECLLNKPSGTQGWITAPGKPANGTTTGVAPAAPVIKNTPAPVATTPPAPLPVQTPAPVATSCAPAPGETTCPTTSG